MKPNRAYFNGPKQWADAMAKAGQYRQQLLTDGTNSRAGAHAMARMWLLVARNARVNKHA